MGLKKLVDSFSFYTHLRLLNPILTNMKKRVLESSNYSSIFINGKTLRLPIDANKPITEIAWPEFYDVSAGNKCATGKCPFCFLPNSLVRLKDEIKEISNIKFGDYVYTVNENTREVEYKQVSQLHKRDYCGQIISIELENGKTINCTPNHKLYTERGWIEAGRLLETDILTELNKS